MDCLSATGLTSSVFSFFRRTEERYDDITVSWMITGSGFISAPLRDLMSQPRIIQIVVFFKLFSRVKQLFKDTRNVLYEEISLHLLDKPNIGKLTQCKDGTCHGVKNK